MTDVPSDPFGERRRSTFRRTHWLLGTRCVFESDSRHLMALVDAACGGLPPQRLPGAAPVCHIELRLKRGGRSFGAAGPPPARAGAGAGLLTGIVDADNHVVVAPAARSASIAISTALLAHPYHARYELIEFALLTLLSRVRELVPLHAACVGFAGRGLLLLGGSGAGKSTLCFHAATGGLSLLAEDSLFVEPRDLMACALPAFVHLRRDAPRLLRGSPLARVVRASPVIRRRSGERKFEVDLRSQRGARLARPLRLVGVVRLESAPRAALLRPLAWRAIAAQLRREQSYASVQAGWEPFLRGVSRLPAFELARGAHPRDSVAALHEALRLCRS